MRQPMRFGAAIAAGLAWALSAGVAQAGLFDDDEARKAILDLRARVQAVDDAAKARHAEGTQNTAQLLEQIRRSLFELNGQLEAQRAEIARLRGTQEQLAKDIAELQRRQKDLTQGLDERLKRLEPQVVSIDGRDVQVEPEERRLYDEAIAQLKAGDFSKAGAQLAAFIRRYPGSGYLASARYWLGNAQYGRRDYKEAIATFRSFVAELPEHPRAAEALLSVANCQTEMKDAKGARRSLDDLIRLYPASEAAAVARERIGSGKG